MTSIIDQVAPHTRFHLGIEYRDGRGLRQCVQLLNREGRSIFSVDIVDGKADREDGRAIFIKDLAPHVEYFITLCERWVSTRNPSGFWHG